MSTPKPCVTDVLEFAATNPDYWEGFLSGSDYPQELSDEETKALDAARAHIELLIVDLLHTAGNHLATTLGASRIAQTRFKKASTTKNRRVQLPVPEGLEDHLYRVEFFLERNDAGNAIELYASLVAKKGSLDTIGQSLTAKGIAHTVDDYHVYAPGSPIVKGVALDSLAAGVAKLAADMINTFSAALSSTKTPLPALSAATPSSTQKTPADTSAEPNA